MRPRRSSRSRRDPGPPPGPAQPNRSRLGPTCGSLRLQSRAHCQTRQPGRMRRPARPLNAHRTCHRWRPTRSTHTSSTGAHAGTVAGAHNMRAATVEGRYGPSQPPAALRRRPTRRAVAATRRHQTLRNRGEQGRIGRGRRGREGSMPWRRLRCAVATGRARERACTGRAVDARAPHRGELKRQVERPAAVLAASAARPGRYAIERLPLAPRSSRMSAPVRPGGCCEHVSGGPGEGLFGTEFELSRRLRTLRRAEEVVATAARGLRWRGSTPDARNRPQQPTSGPPLRAVTAYA
jgi:hypothetical protein